VANPFSGATHPQETVADRQRGVGANSNGIRRAWRSFQSPEHLGIGRASGRDLSVGFGLSASLHLAGIEAHGLIVSDFISL